MEESKNVATIVGANRAALAAGLLAAGPIGGTPLIPENRKQRRGPGSSRINPCETPSRGASQEDIREWHAERMRNRKARTAAYYADPKRPRYRPVGRVDPKGAIWPNNKFARPGRMM